MAGHETIAVVHAMSNTKLDGAYCKQSKTA